ncbi:MAG: ORF6N domain-containing protein [Sulfurimonadaceae bacterium]
MNIEISNSEIENKIYTIRGLQVMLDSDLAELYGVELKRLNEQVKRNIERFPNSFRFQLTQEEYDSLGSQVVTLEKKQNLRSQIATLKKEHGKHRKYLPYVFTEQGVSMLSAVLKSKTAIEMSIQIINSFVQMRKFISHNAGIFQRLDSLEQKQQFTDKKLDTVLNAIEDKAIRSKQGIFFDGQVFDAYVFVSKLIKSAKSSLVLIDNYVDESVLTLLSKRDVNCKVTIYTKTISKQLQLDLKKHNEQYSSIEIKTFKEAHDRFLIIDDRSVYHIGASLKDLGKKWFAFSKFDKEALALLDKLDMV